MLSMQKFKKKGKLYLNKLYFINAIIYSVIVCCFGVMTAYFSYIYEFSRLLSTSKEAINVISKFYEEKNENFWTIYTPIFSSTEFLNVTSSFFGAGSSDVLSNPNTRKVFIELLSIIANQDIDIELIMLYRKVEPEGFYVFFPKTKEFKQVYNDFPYVNELRNKANIRQIYGSRTVKININEERMVYAIAGGSYSFYENYIGGSLLVGYNIDSIKHLYSEFTMNMPSRILILTMDGSVIFDSNGTTSGQIYDELSLADADGIVKDQSGKRFYVKTIMRSGRNYMVAYIVPWWTLFEKANKNTFLIMGVTSIFILLSLVSYYIAAYFILKQVNIISHGLAQIGRKNLGFKIPIADRNDEFGAIARAINCMTDEMNNNIQKLYIYQLKQKIAEMGELQAKFNPHFLYNTLEVIRAQISESGDRKAEEMLVLLSNIFRGFINSKPFVTIQEELSFCDMYLDLFRLRYEDNVEVIFDIETGILSYGIIRNLLQPLIENYFLHGYSLDVKDNFISISGYFKEDNYI
jgi:two-component system sensor histidine kinase YesM